MGSMELVSGLQELLLCSDVGPDVIYPSFFYFRGGIPCINPAIVLVTRLTWTNRCWSCDGSKCLQVLKLMYASYKEIGLPYSPLLVFLRSVFVARALLYAIGRWFLAIYARQNGVLFVTLASRQARILASGRRVGATAAANLAAPMPVGATPRCHRRRQERGRWIYARVGGLLAGGTSMRGGGADGV
jgi:hypothetical protein